MAIKREIPEVNAGSMADIAFLLLIFFLVTTTIETDKGLNRMLPTDEEGSKIKEKNLFRVSLNAKNEILVEDTLTDISFLREKAIAFLDNGGILEGEEHCSYCRGERNKKSSDNPKKAIISLSNTRETNYGSYITVQNELVGAYTYLRNRESLKMYGVSYTGLLDDYSNVGLSYSDKLKIKEKIELLRALYPLKLSEAEINTK
jgi:biopolymer transport protein ExbD